LAIETAKASIAKPKAIRIIVRISKVGFRRNIYF
jgi:hypothetical protein